MSISITIVSAVGIPGGWRGVYFGRSSRDRVLLLQDYSASTKDYRSSIIPSFVENDRVGTRNDKAQELLRDTSQLSPATRKFQAVSLKSRVQNLTRISARLIVFMCHLTKLPTAKPVPMTARSKTRVCGRSPAEIVGSNPTGTCISVCCECCVL